MRLCTVCYKNKPEVPDREIMGRPIKRICRECHSNRLRKDLERVINATKGR